MIVQDFTNAGACYEYRRGTRAGVRRRVARWLMPSASPTLDPIRYNLLFERFLNPECNNARY
ncbi:MAG: hypothetical protein IPL35_04655 [Sphingobacteriales bacterium]|nr:hypothetical protein [Sphingobacteriales bacterium]